MKDTHPPYLIDYPLLNRQLLNFTLFDNSIYKCPPLVSYVF